MNHNGPLSLYGSSLSLLTDLYQLTMSYAYWKSGFHKKESVFHLFFRRPPFNGGFTIASGLESVINYLNRFHFDKSDLDYLSTLKDSENANLFPDEFLNYLEKLSFSCHIDALI